jgi:hypothetical protein
VKGTELRGGRRHKVAQGVQRLPTAEAAAGPESNISAAQWKRGPNLWKQQDLVGQLHYSVTPKDKQGTQTHLKEQQQMVGQL